MNGFKKTLLASGLCLSLISSSAIAYTHKDKTEKCPATNGYCPMSGDKTCNCPKKDGTCSCPMKKKHKKMKEEKDTQTARKHGVVHRQHEKERERQHKGSMIKPEPSQKESSEEREGHLESTGMVEEGVQE
ncbi:TPA: hypothetical protein DEO28_01260 [Candidatus Dependentiae bacterium]|nr:MAG: hypothetical protein UR14_C0003G0102 [candidate division TM6 bacterium GW2011_GWE2_31_21]KKP53734.1 MAG: hypothetical protein UR43_C0003G0055 [candidate division TM6 bacterium GW2011_GWF2_33_332]HBS48512.1 hypothetical protein [Candidatus Dependentiae bacterium]HBZ73127.1 hypothetical protein [Candidatus Dependentiae bacterium]